MKSPYSHVLGIDPGESGGYAVLDSNFEVISVSKYQSETDMVAELKAWRGVKDICAVIEDVHASPIMNPASAFAFGDNFGAWRGAAKAVGLTIFGLRPQQWQSCYPGMLPELKETAPDKRRREHKNNLRNLANTLAGRSENPAVFTLATCDAYLIARAALTNLRGTGLTGGKIL
jgi:hypothetical protein